MIINIFIQARMSSSRFPGKVLAPLKGVPLIKWLIDSALSIKQKNQVVVLTSTEHSDDPLVAYLKEIGCAYFRGHLENVFNRFQKALVQFPCDYFVRLSADSPYLQPDLIESLIESVQQVCPDFASNVYSRKFPKGQSVEMAKTVVLQSIVDAWLTDEDREHIMPYFYRSTDKYKGLYFDTLVDRSTENMCVDTVADLKRLEQFVNAYSLDKQALSIATTS